MNDLPQVDALRTRTNAATQAAAMVEEDSRPRREIMTRTQLGTTAAAHHSEPRQVEDELGCRADHACAELLCKTSAGVLEVWEHWTFGCCMVCDSAAWRLGVSVEHSCSAQLLCTAIHSKRYTICAHFASFPKTSVLTAPSRKRAS